VEQAQVALHFFAHAGPLDFNHDFLAAVQPRPVHLPDAGRAQRHVVKLGKQLVERAAQLGLDDEARLGHREGRHVALQLLKLVDEFLGQQVGAVAQGLRQFDEGGAQLLDDEANTLPTRGFEHRAGVVFEPAAAAALAHEAA
jgi:hypothetical protein